MKRFFNLKFLLALVLGAGVLAVASALFDDDLEQNDLEDDYTYGDPDGEESDGDVSSFVD